MEESTHRDISATEPITLAIDRAKLICFEPFDAGKWLCLGFCVFLALLFEDGVNLNFNMSGGSGPGGGMPQGIKEALNWIVVNSAIGLAIGLGILGFAVLVLWLRCRGIFMLIDGVVHNRGLVVQPWSRFAHLGDSLFKFMFVFGFVWFLGLALITGLGVVIALGDIRASTFGVLAIVALCLSIFLFLVWWIVMGTIGAIVNHLVVPVMYMRNLAVLPALEIVRREFLPGNAGAVAIFILLKIVALFVLGAANLAVCCVTCCLGSFLPYIGRVLALPVHVFNVSFSLYFVEQFGPQWKIFPDLPPPEPPPLEGGHYEPPQIAPPPLLPDRPPPLPPEPPQPPPVLPLD